MPMRGKVIGKGLRFATIFALAAMSRAAAPAKKPLTFRAFFHAVTIAAVRMAPDGQAVIIETRRPDYAHNRFRSDLWLYRTALQRLLRLTVAGHDFDPHWSPDGRWIAFLSNRKKQGPQLYVISPRGGEAIQMTQAKAGGVHTYVWAPDSRSLYFAAKVPLTKTQIAAHTQRWHDVIRYRRDLRPDNLYQVPVPARSLAMLSPPPAQLMAHARLRIQQMIVTPDGRQLVYLTASRRGPIFITGNDGYRKHQLFLVNLAAAGHPTRQLTHTQAVVADLRMAANGRGFYFLANSNIPGRYADLSGRVFYQPLTGGAPTRLAPNYAGSFSHFTVSPSGAVIATGQYHARVPAYRVYAGGLTPLPVKAGTYQHLSIGAHSPRVAFVYSTWTSPVEVYLASDDRHLAAARPITHFNANLAARALPREKTFWWTADDGARVEGLLIYPPGKEQARHLPLFVLIHGGPEDADVNHWEADWYQWGSLAASQGWLVFEPNYRGSSGYGDAFMRRIVPHIVSRPGKDILEGVRALIRGGWADPRHMAIGGYSYGGYMTDWLITQTTEFKAAVTGAGAIENTANWGNDDLNYDDTYYLGGFPWQNEKIYNREAAIWQIYKVKTPTQIVMGIADRRVATCEDYLLDRALRAVGVPTEMLQFPGEHHGLGHNPWHGRIKVREELKWIKKYAG